VVLELRRPRIAVIDDDPEIRALLLVELDAAGFEVRAAADGRSGIALARSWLPDAIVLDVVMPDVGGLDAIALIRRFTQVPIVLMSARGGVRDRVAGLEAGGDDYVTKPLALPELAARLKSALRRPQLDRSEVIRFADLELDLAQRSARRGGRRIPLSTREYTLLATLLRRPKRVFSKNELVDLVWGAEHPIRLNTVETYISYLRAKLDQPPAPPLIHTVRGIGYRLSLDD
jgi:two-component system OmpR family response regulator